MCVKVFDSDLSRSRTRKIRRYKKTEILDITGIFDSSIDYVNIDFEYDDENNCKIVVSGLNP